jgi:alanine racemase
MCAPAETGAVVKADAYGLGVAPVARRLAGEGCHTFFVALIEEGVALRAVLPSATIVILGVPVEAELRALLEYRLTPVLNHPGDLRAWAASGAAADAWLHLDTGMHRLGFSPAEWQALLASDPDWSGLRVTGVMSHYACADVPAHPLNAHQRDTAVSAARTARLPLSLANSSGIFLGAEFRGDLVRPGMALYGLNPTPARANPMRPAVGLEAQVLQVRQVDADGWAGYGATYSVAPGQRLATIGLGYADGLHRALSNHGAVFFDGQRAPIAGRVSMDTIIVDISEISAPIGAGDWAEVIGPNQSADSLADSAGTIGYEVLSSLGHRYARTYLRSESDV